MGRAKAKPKKVPSTDLEGVLGLTVTAAAPRKRGRPRKIVKEELDQEEEAAAEEEEQEMDELEANNGAESAQESERKLLDLLNKNHDEIGKAVSQQDKVPKKRGRPPKAQKSSSTTASSATTIDDELAESTIISSKKKEFQNGIERPVKREGLSRRKSEPRRAAGFAAAR